MVSGLGLGQVLFLNVPKAGGTLARVRASVRCRVRVSVLFLHGVIRVRVRVRPKP